MDDTFKFGQKINQNTQRVIENIYLIKILNTYKKSLKNFRKTIHCLLNHNLKIITSTI